MNLTIPKLIYCNKEKKETPNPNKKTKNNSMEEVKKTPSV
jgi:hypothetical protein